MARGSEILLDVLDDEGVTHIFGNPGTTELPLMRELARDERLHYILALEENSAVALADGYARATKRPAFVNLHAAAGLCGGLGNLTNAKAGHSALVVTAGQEDRRHLVLEPLLSGDLVSMARAVSKWQHEVRHADELSLVLRRAFNDAQAVPAGPVFISIPVDVLEEVSDTHTANRSTVAAAAIAPHLEELATLLSEAAPHHVVLVAGDEVGSADAMAPLVDLAEALGARVFGAPLHSNLVFPTDHPLWCGMLPPVADRLRGTFEGLRRVFVIGARAFLLQTYSPGPVMPTGSELLHLHGHSGEVGWVCPTHLGVVGDVSASLNALVPLVRKRMNAILASEALAQADSARRAAIEQFEGVARQRYGAMPINPMAAIHALMQGLPNGTLVVDEAMSSGVYVRRFHLTNHPNSYYFSAGGGLGWAMPAAMGVKLARPASPVLCVIGDGSAMYSIQALWTAAHYGIAVVFVILNNGEYGILKRNSRGQGKEAHSVRRHVGLDLRPPPIDFVALARGMGVEAMVIDRARDIADAVRGGFEKRAPTVIELPISQER